MNAVIPAVCLTSFALLFACSQGDDDVSSDSSASDAAAGGDEDEDAGGPSGGPSSSGGGDGDTASGDNRGDGSDDGDGSVHSSGGDGDQPVSTAPAAVQATGQTTCYAEEGAPIDCAGTGQDGEYQNGVPVPSPRYTDLSDGTVRDNHTGLIWLKDAECLGKTNWEESLILSNGLEDGQCGLSDGSTAGDWRLPNFHEILSVMEWSRTEWTSGGKALADGFPFTDVKQELYWTSTTDAGEPEEARAVNLGWSGVFKTEAKSLDYWTWAVREDEDTESAPAKVAATNQTACFDAGGSAIDCDGTGQDGDIQAGVPWPSPRFSDNGDGSVTDNLTELIWLKKANCFDPTSFADALEQASQLADGACELTDGSEAGDWRIPNFRELVSVMDWSSFNPLLPQGHPFDGPRLRLHWTSTASLPNSDGAARDQVWIISPFHSGNFHTAEKADSNEHFWPVRDMR